MHLQFSGRYRLQVFHGDTDILLKDTGWFDNLITDNGLNLLGADYTPRCYVGSDSATPTTSDTSIAGVLASATGLNGAGGVQVSSAPYYGYMQRSFVFSIGAIQGTIRQVAIGSSDTNLFSKALLTAVDGSPTTLTLSGVDRLTLTYELRQCINTGDFSGSIDINGTTFDYAGRACEIDDASYWRPSLGMAMGTSTSGNARLYCSLRTGATALGTVLTNPNGTTVASSLSGKDAYVANSYTMPMWSEWYDTLGLLTNINAFDLGTLLFTTTTFSMGGRWQFLLDGSVEKTQYQKLRIEWAYTWGRCA